jgi:Spy/CpxP family protein refolding chaperone
MKHWLFILTLSLASASVLAQENVAAPDPAEAAKYAAVLEKRAGDILQVLDLSDTNRSARVHDLIVGQYRALNTWHATNDARLKAVRKDAAATAEIRASLKSLHDSFLAGLAQSLIPEQVEQVKDKLTYGKVQFTYQGYVNQYPDLTDAQKAEVLRLLKEAREEAMDGGSAKEKTAVFTRFKGKINNYLAKQGVHKAAAKPAAQPQ